MVKNLKLHQAEKEGSVAENVLRNGYRRNKRMKEKKIEFLDYTAAFYDSILFDKEEVFKGCNYNRIKPMGIIIQGSTGIGKTTVAKNILHHIKDYYGPENVHAIYTNNVSLGALMEVCFKKSPNRNRPIQVLIFDDATTVKLKPKEIRKFFSLRHEAEDNLGIKEGVVYSVLLTHEWFQLATTFRRSSNRVVALSVPNVDLYGRRTAEKLFGKGQVKELIKIQRKAEKYDTYKGRGLVLLPDRNEAVGTFTFKLLDEKYIELKGSNEIQECEILYDVATSTILYHEPEPRMKQLQDLSSKERIDREREQTKLRMRRYRERLKKANTKSVTST